MLAASLMVTYAVSASELSEADQKWAAAVEKMITKGTQRISTPDAKRAELAVELAKKLNHEGRIEKSQTGYVVYFSTAKSFAGAQTGK